MSGIPARLRNLGACVLVAVVLLVGFAQTSVGKSVAHTIGLASASEPFTELYFSHPQAVAEATQGEDRLAVTQRVSFVIANHESKQMTYHWQITAAGMLRSGGQITLPSDTQATVATRAAIATGCRFSRTKTPRRVGATRREITVKLAKPDDTISYWVACRA